MQTTKLYAEAPTDDRRQLLKRAKAGELTELEVDIPALVHGGQPYRKPIRFVESLLSPLAASAKGVPFLRNHGQQDTGDRGGTVLWAQLLRETTRSIIVCTVKAVKPWAVEGLLDGTIDRFSIGVLATGPVTCSHCGKELAACSHWPGEEVEGRRVEAVFTAAEIVEVSAVNVPAVPDARGVTIRPTLAAGHTNHRGMSRKEMLDMYTKLTFTLDAPPATGRLAAAPPPEDVSFGSPAYRAVSDYADQQGLALHDRDWAIRTLQSKGRAAAFAQINLYVETRPLVAGAAGRVGYATADSVAQRMAPQLAAQGTTVADALRTSRDYLQRLADDENRLAGPPATAESVLASPELQRSLLSAGVSIEDVRTHGMEGVRRAVEMLNHRPLGGGR